MTTTPTPAAAGWYPAPDGSPAEWWWDGAQWTPPHGHSGRPAVPVGALAKLATATQVLLIVGGTLSLATIGTEAFGIGAVTGYLDGTAGAMGLLEGYDGMSAVVNLLAVVVLVATGVLWAIWQYHAAKQVPGLTRRSPGWHAGSWFVPIVSFWFPYQNISDLWRAVGRSRPAWLLVWWLLWVAANLSISISSRAYASAEALEQVRDAMWMSLAGEVLLVAAVPFAWLVVRGITQGILDRPRFAVGSPAA